MTTPATRKALEELLLSMFPGAELRRVADSLVDDNLSSQLPHDPPAAVATAFVAAAAARGLIDGVFFDRLRTERPKRGADIDAISARWSGLPVGSPTTDSTGQGGGQRRADPNFSEGAPTNPTPKPKPLRVLISYAHESEEHRVRVLALAQQLRADGVDARIDRFVAPPADGWSQWMDAELRAADRVIIVCSPRYFERTEDTAPEGRGLGVSWEWHRIRTEIYSAGGRRARFVPVWFDDAGQKSLPNELWARSHHNVGKLGGPGYDRLLQDLLDHSEDEAPAIGRTPRPGGRDPQPSLGTRSSGSGVHDGSPRAYISYSYDEGEPHKNWVLGLASRLHTDGVDVTFDRWFRVLGESVQTTIDREVSKASHFVLICTPIYKSKAAGLSPGGLKQEFDAIVAQSNSRQDVRVVPVLRIGSWETSLPSEFMNRWGCDLTAYPPREDEYDALRRALLGLPGSSTATGVPGHGLSPKRSDGLIDARLEVLREAMAAVPSVRWALGVAGVAAGGAIAFGFLGGVKAAAVGVVTMLLLMVLLVIFAKGVANGRVGRGPGLVLIWFCLGLVVVSTPIGLLSTFQEDVRRARDTLCDVSGLMCPAAERGPTKDNDTLDTPCGRFTYPTDANWVVAHKSQIEGLYSDFLRRDDSPGAKQRVVQCAEYLAQSMLQASDEEIGPKNDLHIVSKYDYAARSYIMSFLVGSSPRKADLAEHALYAARQAVANLERIRNNPSHEYASLVTTSNMPDSVYSVLALALAAATPTNRREIRDALDHLTESYLASWPMCGRGQMSDLLLRSYYNNCDRATPSLSESMDIPLDKGSFP